MLATEVAGRELDELVAEKVMGLVRGVDFGSLGEHEWKRDEDGKIDILAFDADTHNGPACVKCDYGYCHHCQDKPDPDRPCEKRVIGYSGSVYAAWLVVEHMKEHAPTRFKNLTLVAYAYNRTYASFDAEDIGAGDGPLMCEGNGVHATPLAICRAALAAMDAAAQ